MVNLFDTFTGQLDEAADLLNLDSVAHELLRRPRREFAFTVTLAKDDGSHAVFPGFRVQYNDARGPTYGGVRFGPGETVDNTRARAAWTAWKTALADLPLGGAYGAIACDTEGLSKRELEATARGYARATASFIGLERDIIAPDTYAPPGTGAWMADELSVIKGDNSSYAAASVADETFAFVNSGEAYAKGGVFCVREAAKYLNVELKGARTAVYGFDAVGAAAAKLSAEHFGSRIIAVADPSGGVHNPDGLDAGDVGEFIRRTGSLVDFPSAENVKPGDVLELENADRVKARVLAEAADGVTTPEADEILHDGGVFVIPDVLCTAGAVIAPYFRRAADPADARELENLNMRLDDRITTAFHTVLEERNARNIRMRAAAGAIAVKRIVEAMKRRGWC
jgi:glutamate dehydrogenase (NAD(P)+)